MLASAGFTEESIERVVTSSNGLITRHLTIRLDTVFKAVQLPACIANLTAGLANMDRDTFTLFGEDKIISLLVTWSICFERAKFIRGLHTSSRQKNPSAKFFILHQQSDFVSNSPEAGTQIVFGRFTAETLVIFVSGSQVLSTERRSC